jgi:DNA polymerase I-like protein with 3'-5' exonuclease and polymerase domains
VQLQAQVHDAILGQWRKDDRKEAAEIVEKLMLLPVPINGRVMEIPVEIKAGQNWGNRSPENPQGMKVVTE